MKGVHGFLLAIALGVAGALFNYAYLASKLPDVEMVGFVGIESDAEVARGERLLKEHLMEVEIPRAHVGNLADVAVPYSSVNSVIGSRVWRPLPGGSLLLDEDLDTPPAELKLGPDEGIIWIPVDTRSTVPSLIVPGDRVSFLIARSRIATPTLADDPESDEPQPIPESRGPAGPIETVGPFTVLSLGNRLGSLEVLRAARMPLTQEHVVGIRVDLDQKRELMADAQHLVELLNASGNRPVGIMLHGRPERSR